LKVINAQVLQLAARLVIFLPNLDHMACARETNRGGESAQASSDDEDLFHSPFNSHKRS